MRWVFRAGDIWMIMMRLRGFTHHDDYFDDFVMPMLAEFLGKNFAAITKNTMPQDSDIPF